MERFLLLRTQGVTYSGTIYYIYYNNIISYYNRTVYNIIYYHRQQQLLTLYFKWNRDTVWHFNAGKKILYSSIGKKNIFSLHTPQLEILLKIHNIILYYDVENIKLNKIFQLVLSSHDFLIGIRHSYRSVMFY